MPPTTSKKNYSAYPPSAIAQPGEKAVSGTKVGVHVEELWRWGAQKVIVMSAVDTASQSKNQNNSYC